MQSNLLKLIGCSQPEDCSSCIELVNDVTQVFIDGGWMAPEEPETPEQRKKRLSDEWGDL